MSRVLLAADASLPEDDALPGMAPKERVLSVVWRAAERRLMASSLDFQSG